MEWSFLLPYASVSDTFVSIRFSARMVETVIHPQYISIPDMAPKIICIPSIRSSAIVTREKNAPRKEKNMDRYGFGLPNA